MSVELPEVISSARNGNLFVAASDFSSAIAGVTEVIDVIDNETIEALEAKELRLVQIQHALERLQHRDILFHEALQEGDNQKAQDLHELVMYQKCKLQVATTADPHARAGLELLRGTQTYATIDNDRIDNSCSAMVDQIMQYCGSEFSHSNMAEHEYNIGVMMKRVASSMHINDVTPIILTDANVWDPAILLGDLTSHDGDMLGDYRSIIEAMITRTGGLDDSYDFSGFGESRANVMIRDAEFLIRLLETQQQFTTSRKKTEVHSLSDHPDSYQTIKTPKKTSYIKKPLFLIGPEREKAYNNGTLLR